MTAISVGSLTLLNEVQKGEFPVWRSFVFSPRKVTLSSSMSEYITLFLGGQGNPGWLKDKFPVEYKNLLRHQAKMFWEWYYRTKSTQPAIGFIAYYYYSLLASLRNVWWSQNVSQLAIANVLGTTHPDVSHSYSPVHKALKEYTNKTVSGVYWTHLTQ